MTKNLYVVTGLSNLWDTFKEPYMIDLSDEEFDLFEEFTYLSEPNFIDIKDAVSFSESEKEEARIFQNVINHDIFKDRVSGRIKNLNEEIQRLNEMLVRLEKGA